MLPTTVSPFLLYFSSLALCLYFSSLSPPLFISLSLSLFLSLSPSEGCRRVSSISFIPNVRNRMGQLTTKFDIKQYFQTWDISESQTVTNKADDTCGLPPIQYSNVVSGVCQLLGGERHSRTEWSKQYLWASLADPDRHSVNVNSLYFFIVNPVRTRELRMFAEWVSLPQFPVQFIMWNKSGSNANNPAIMKLHATTIRSNKQPHIRSRICHSQA